jgi:hypothetical protein
MTVDGGHTQPFYRVALEVELDYYGRFVAHYPSVMARFYRNHLRSREFERATVGILNMYLPARKESDVPVHT